MADNTTLNTMTGGDVIGADDISGVKYQRVKLIKGADGVNDGDISAANPLPATLQPSTSGGWSTLNATSGDGSTALTNTAQAVKASAGQLGGWYIYNPNASAIYVSFYNVASGSVTVGTTGQFMVVVIPATSGANVEFTNGIAFGTAISVAATTTGGGNTAPTTALEANIFYK